MKYMRTMSPEKTKTQKTVTILKWLLIGFVYVFVILSLSHLIFI